MIAKLFQVMKKTHFYLVDTSVIIPGAAVSELQFNIIHEEPFVSLPTQKWAITLSNAEKQSTCHCSWYHVLSFAAPFFPLSLLC